MANYESAATMILKKEIEKREEGKYTKTLFQKIKSLFKK